ncbi:MAG: zinc ribbon protein, partial [Conexibacter sp.]|nr:zinc ribbon protein [Conexibacter sp.]
MSTHSHPVPVFGRDGEPCPACGAPLAGDQRYCLHCGTRRPEARLEFLDVLDADVRARAAAPVLA